MCGAEARRTLKSLLDKIYAIRQAGTVAPRYCWLTMSTVSKNGKTYSYARLVSEKLGAKPKIHSLGRLGSLRHQEWQQAIARREAIVELEHQLKLVQLLIERQTVADRWLQAVLISSALVSAQVEAAKMDG